MREVHQAVWGMLAAFLSAFLVFGGLAISLTETRLQVALAPAQTQTPTQPVPTQAPGEPTYTPSPTALPTSTPTIVFPVTCDYPAGWIEISVGVGDTLYTIAERYQVGVDDLRRGNCLEIDRLMVGMSIHVPMLATDTLIPSETAIIAPTLMPTNRSWVTCSRPPGWVIYYVKTGDNLYRIGLAVGVPYQELMVRNCLKTYTIYPGQRLYVPVLPVLLITPTPIPYKSPTALPPIPSSTPIPPTSLPPILTPTLVPPTIAPPTLILPSATPVISTATPLLPSSTPITPSPTQTLPSATWTYTLPPPITQTPLPTAVLTDTPEPNTSTPIPTATDTSIPLPTRTPAPTIVFTPGISLVPLSP